MDLQVINGEYNWYCSECCTRKGINYETIKNKIVQWMPIKGKAGRKKKNI